MLALLAAIVFAQSATIQIGKDKQDSVAQAKRDSIAIRREARRDSLRAREHNRDSVRHDIRLARKLPVTPSVLASAFKDPAARELLLRARAARLTQDSSLTAYDANSYERLSVGMGFRKIGRNRLLLRTERATHVMLQHGKGAGVDVQEPAAFSDDRRRWRRRRDQGSTPMFHTCPVARPSGSAPGWPRRT